MFIKRLGYFMIGLSIGIIFLTFFFKKKSDETGVSFCYLPNCRVLKDMRSKPLTYSNDVAALFKNKTLDTLVIHQFLTDGDIDFGNSDTKSKPCKTYRIEGEVDSRMATMEVKNCPDKVTILEFK